MITLKNVSKSYGSEEILTQINLHFDLKKSHVLLGQSGSGKSTLLKLILGLLDFDKGTILLDGISVSPSTQRQIAKKVGYVVQEGGLFPHLTASENITLLAKTSGWTTLQISQRIDELSELVQCNESLLERYPLQLSGGQRQRVGIMRALMLNPEFLSLDEPLGALDPLVRSELQFELRELFQTLQKTVLLVTHDMNEAVTLGNTITLLLFLLFQTEALSDQTKPTIRVGSKAFTESYILAEILSQVIEETGEAEVERRFGLGGTGIVAQALESGEIDLYPEYTGTISHAILKNPELKGTDQIQDQLRKSGYAMGPLFGFNNTYALAVRKSIAQKKTLEKISDLQDPPNLRAGVSHEFLSRPDGFRGLEETYGLLPIVRNTYSGIISISPRLEESGRALGLSSWQRPRLIEIPLASMSISSGVKTSAVINVGTATLAALIGAGGYGTLIVTGLALNDLHTIIQGALPAAILSLVVHFFFETIDLLAVPKGMKVKL
jgi:osmoprotectant transport system ATP-binding protein